MINRTFNFVKASNANLLNQELSASKISSLIESIEVQGNKLTVIATRTLTESERSLLFKIVTTHNPAQVVVRDRIESAIAFGRQLIVEFATENVLLGLNTQQVAYLLGKLLPIKALLESGSLYTAMEAMQALSAEPLLNQERINRYVAKIKAHLGIP